MASRSKNKTTFAKLAREGRLRERRMEKAARKDARKRAAEDPFSQTGDAPMGEDGQDELASPADDAAEDRQPSS